MDTLDNLLPAYARGISKWVLNNPSAPIESKTEIVRQYDKINLIHRKMIRGESLYSSEQAFVQKWSEEVELRMSGDLSWASMHRAFVAD